MNSRCTLTVEEVAARYGLPTHTIYWFIRNTFAVEQYVEKVGYFVYISPDALPIFDDYFLIPYGWIDEKTAVRRAGINEHQFRYRVYQIPKDDLPKYRRRFYGGIMYSPEIIDLVKDTQREYINLVQPVPAGQQWFTSSEFAALFGVNVETIYKWIERKHIPDDLLQRGDGSRKNLLIHRDAIAINDGKHYKIPYKKDNDVIEWDRLVIDEGYELTPEQHEIRRRLKQQHFDNI